MNQKVFLSKYVYEKMRRIKDGKGLNEYLSNSYSFSETDIVPNHEITEPSKLKVLLPVNKPMECDLENAIAIHQAYPKLNGTQASDFRFWVFLAHTVYWEYLQKRWPLKGEPEDIKENIMQHWFINGLTVKNISRHGIASLWWYAHLTYDPTKKDPYILTRELFSMKDYSRFLIEEQLGFIDNFRHTFLEFVLDHPEIFEKYKEAKTRALMVKMNFIGGYTQIGSLNKEEILKLFEIYKDDIAKINKAR